MPGKQHGLILMASIYIIQNHEEVSGCTCKELGSHHSVLKNNKKQTKTDKQTNKHNS